MSRFSRDTPHDFPPLAPWPGRGEWVLDMTLAQLAGCWLMLRCDCGHQVPLPLRLMAAQHGWGIKLEPFMAKLKCQRCGARPRSIRLSSDGSEPSPQITGVQQIVLRE